MTHSERIGEQLIASGDVSPEELNTALAKQTRSKDKLGQILLTTTRINPLRLYETLAKQQAVEHLNLDQQPPDASLLSYDLLPEYIARRFVPVRLEGNTLTIACCNIDEDLRSWAQQIYPHQLVFALTPPRDIRLTIHRAFHEQISQHSLQHLAQQFPDLSAYQTITARQRLILLLLLASFVSALAIFPHGTLVFSLCLANLFYLVTIAFRLLLYGVSPTRNPASSAPQDPRDDTLPFYSILIPLYKEQDGIPHILNAMRQLDYPASRLDIKLVVEADDTLTIEAIKRARPEPYFEIIRVPYSHPRTKPKACNYALTFARGDYVTIYDAEDVPEPLQLRKAVAAFQSAPPDVICLQARLNYYNWNETLLSRLFAIEYATLFDVMLPGLQALHIPIPLGGTSNHIHLKRLRDIGDWDPYNVTEDADLGVRLSLLGYRTQILDSITLEEAPITLAAWINQRSRWIKGYMQTWLVHMRHPITLYRRISRRGFWGFQFFIGSPSLVFLASPILWLLTLCWSLDLIPVEALPDWLIHTCLAMLVVGALTQLLYAIRAVRGWNWHSMTPVILIFPFYWLLHSAASFKALWQLMTRPHFWEKTTHRITKVNTVHAIEKIRQITS